MPPANPSIPLASAGLSTRTYNRLTWLFTHRRVGPLQQGSGFAADAAYDAALAARLAEWEEIERALTLADLATLTEVELMAVPYFGVGGLAEVKATLARYGMSLAR